jgi:hypothetical protein
VQFPQFDELGRSANPALRNEGFGKALQVAQTEFDRHHPHVVVGSGRAVAM